MKRTPGKTGAPVSTDTGAPLLLDPVNQEEDTAAFLLRVLYGYRWRGGRLTPPSGEIKLGAIPLPDIEGDGDDASELIDTARRVFGAVKVAPMEVNGLRFWQAGVRTRGEWTVSYGETRGRAMVKALARVYKRIGYRVPDGSDRSEGR